MGAGIARSGGELEEEKAVRDTMFLISPLAPLLQGEEAQPPSLVGKGARGG